MDKNIMEILHDNANSIEVNKTTKGFTWSVKCYGNEFENIMRKVEEIVQELKNKYPSE
jgi:uncharacterized protein YoxC